MRANLFLSVAVAITGIGFPIALSFVLLPLVGATPVQSFAAGAALCSTSLGTTFTILSTSGLSATRLGTVLTTAAMLDDVVGLIMVQVISNLGESDDFDAVTVARPLAVSFGFAIFTPLACRFVVKPITDSLTRMREGNSIGLVERVCKMASTPFLFHSLILLGFVASSTYAGTSNLFAAYLAGASISWWDSEVQHMSRKDIQTTLPGQSSTLVQPNSSNHNTSADNAVKSALNDVGTMRNKAAPHNPENVPLGMKDSKIEALDRTGSAVFHQYYAHAVRRILKPFFFVWLLALLLVINLTDLVKASIGFAIPITEMFSGDIVWRGIVYTILMLFGKVVTGIWLIRLNPSWPAIRIPKSARSLVTFHWKRSAIGEASKKGVESEGHEMQVSAKEAHNEPVVTRPERLLMESNDSSSPTIPSSVEPAESTVTDQPFPKKIDKPLSLYPAAMLGTAMTARGEIGFLIASLAETTGLFTSADADPNANATGSSKIYLVVTWAIVLCTIIGPLSVGTLVKRVRRLQAERENNPAKADPLGIWGLS